MEFLQVPDHHHHMWWYHVGHNSLLWPGSPF